MTTEAPEAPWDVAERRASQYAPKPNRDPVTVGLMGAVIAWAITFVFIAAAGLDLDRVQIARIVTIAIGFLVPFGFVWNERRRHYKRSKQEYPRALAEYEQEKARLARVALDTSVLASR